MNLLKTGTMAALVGLAVTAASPALAHYTTTRCDRDGDRCWRVVCENDGDDCRRTNSYNDYDRNYYSGYNRGYYNSRYYDRDRYRHWVCDSDGDRCHWSYYRW
ncbi:MAG: hypothetical protein KGJ78_11725 [Alphaproteobacteria bacterium]|nr:hypothetical protein [Alphaproteobacteria bacterium]